MRKYYFRLICIFLLAITPYGIAQKTQKIIRVGYITYDASEDITNPKNPRLQVLIKSLETLVAHNSNIDFNICLGNYYQIFSWLKNGYLDVALVPSFLAIHLADDYQPLFSLQVSESSNKTGLFYWSKLEKSSNKSISLKDYDEYLQKVLDVAQKKEKKAILKNYKISMVTHFSSSGFIRPVMYAAEWLNLNTKDNDPSREKFWELFLEKISFRLYHKNQEKVRSGQKLLRFTYDEKEPDKERNLGKIPSDAIIFNRNLPELSWIKDNLPAGCIKIKVDDQGKEKIVCLYEFEEKNYQEYKKELQIFKKDQKLAEWCREWYSQNHFRFTLDETFKILRYKQNSSNVSENCALVLPGGGVKSAYQSKLLDILYEKEYLMNIQEVQKRIKNKSLKNREEVLAIDTITGTSGGAMTALLTAHKTTTNPVPLTDLWLNITPFALYPFFDMMRWLSFYFLILIFGIVSLCYHFNSAPKENHSPKKKFVAIPDFCFIVAVLFIFIPAFFTNKIITNEHAVRDHVPSIEGFFYAAVIFLIHLSITCIVKNTEQNAQSNKYSYIASLVSFVFGLSLWIIAVWQKNSITSNLGCLFIMSSMVLLANAKKFGIQLIGIKLYFKALGVLFLYGLCSYLFLSIFWLCGLTSFLELTAEFWLYLFISGLLSSIIFIIVWHYGKNDNFFRQGIENLYRFEISSPYFKRPLLSMIVIFLIGYTFWNLVLAPAVYGKKSAYSFFQKVCKQKLENKKLQTNLIVTAIAPSSIEIDDQNIRGDFYFCFPKENLSLGKSKDRWRIMQANDYQDFVDPVFSSGAPFPIFPPHKVKTSQFKGVFIDGGYGHNIPIEAAEIAGSRRVLIIHSSPRAEEPDYGYKGNWGQLTHYTRKLFGMMFEQAQKQDKRIANKLIVASLYPCSRERSFPFLADFRKSTINNMVKYAEEDFASQKRIGIIESWGVPLFYRIKLKTKKK